MRGWVRKNRITAALILGLTELLAGFGTWCFFTVSYRSAFFQLLGILGTFVQIALYVGICFLIKKEENFSTQLRTVSMVGALLSVILLVTTGSALMQEKEIVYLIVEIAWLLLFGVSIFWQTQGRQQKISFSERKSQFFAHKGLYVLLVITAFFLIDPDALQFKWDGRLYYITCEELTLGSLSNLAIYGHIAQTYGALVRIAILITGNTGTAMTGVNIVLMTVSICSFYGLLREIAPGKKEWKYILATAVYAWSPFLLGMVYYHSLDYACQCLFPAVLYCLYKRKWIHFILTSLLFCFTKEPAIVVYGAMCIGVVISDLAQDKEFAIVGRIKRLFLRKKYYLMVMPGILWITVYGLLGPWSAGEGGFAIDSDYILSKLKMLYIFNFNWIFSLVCLAGFLVLVYQKKWKELLVILPIFCSQIAFTLFSCLFRTINHPRYNDTNQVTLCLMAIVISFYCCRDMVRMLAHGIIACLMLLSCFKTIDPVSRLLFTEFQIGKEVMISPQSSPLGDSMIYNRQMLGLEGAMKMALKDALAGSDIVLFPSVEENAYHFDGMTEGKVPEESCRRELEYWNPVDQKRELPDSSNLNGLKEFEVYHLAENINWENLEDKVQGEVNYIFLPCAGQELVKEIEERYHISEIEEYHHKGWCLYRVSFHIEQIGG